MCHRQFATLPVRCAVIARMLDHFCNAPGTLRPKSSIGFV
jgi:hypothetical protein